MRPGQWLSAAIIIASHDGNNETQARKPPGWLCHVGAGNCDHDDLLDSKDTVAGP
jgi:hypothetical protein